MCSIIRHLDEEPSQVYQRQIHETLLHRKKNSTQVSGRDLTYSNLGWIEMLSHMDDQSLVWRAPRMTPCDVIYRCGKT